jgi:hypothetical protein
MAPVLLPSTPGRRGGETAPPERTLARPARTRTREDTARGRRERCSHRRSRPARIACMATREEIHKLVDELPESQLDPLVEFIASRGHDPLARRLDSAPTEDEEISAEEQVAAAAGRADIAAGRTVPLAEIKREFGLR